MLKQQDGSWKVPGKDSRSSTQRDTTTKEFSSHPALVPPVLHGELQDARASSLLGLAPIASQLLHA